MSDPAAPVPSHGALALTIVSLIAHRINSAFSDVTLASIISYWATAIAAVVSVLWIAYQFWQSRKKK